MRFVLGILFRPRQKYRRRRSFAGVFERPINYLVVLIAQTERKFFNGQDIFPLGVFKDAHAAEICHFLKPCRERPLGALGVRRGDVAGDFRQRFSRQHFPMRRQPLVPIRDGMVKIIIPPGPQRIHSSPTARRAFCPAGRGKESARRARKDGRKRKSGGGAIPSRMSPTNPARHARRPAAKQPRKHRQRPIDFRRETPPVKIPADARRFRPAPAPASKWQESHACKNWN